MSDQPRFPAWMGHRAAQALGGIFVLIGVLNLWFPIGEGADWFRIFSAIGGLLLFVVIFATTIHARRQNRLGPPQ